jgi:hypothetical protein
VRKIPAPEQAPPVTGKDGKTYQRKPQPKPPAAQQEPNTATDELTELVSVTDLLGTMVDRFTEVFAAWGDRPIPQREGTAITRELYRIHLLTGVLLDIPEADPAAA